MLRSVDFLKESELSHLQTNKQKTCQVLVLYKKKVTPPPFLPPPPLPKKTPTSNNQKP